MSVPPPDRPSICSAAAMVPTAVEVVRWSSSSTDRDAQEAGGGSSTQPPGPGRVAAASGPHVPLA